MNLAVIDAPSSPPGWEESRAHLIRIVDPSGRAVAWFAPEHGAMCAGFAVRASGRRGVKWTQMFHAIEPSSPAPLAAGGCVVRCTLPADSPLPMHPWQYIARDPTAVVMETVIPTNGDDCRYGDTKSSLHLRLTARLDNAALMLDLEANNVGTCAISPHLAFQVSFAAGSTETKLQLVTTTTAPPTDTVPLEPGARVRIGIAFRAMVIDDDLQDARYR